MRRRYVLLAFGAVMLVSAQVLFPQVEPVMADGSVVFSAQGWSQLGVYLLSIASLAGYMAVEMPATVQSLQKITLRPGRALGRLLVTGAGVGSAVYLAGVYSTMAVVAAGGVTAYGVMQWLGIKTRI